MTSQELLDKINSRFTAVSSKENYGILNLEVEKGKVREALTQLRDEMKFDHMNFMTALDWPETNIIEVIYRLYSYTSKDSIVIRVKLDRSNPEILTVSDIYRTAEWHERETGEMFGITFTDHPDPRGVLLPDGFKGSPLRKDFSHPNMIKLPEV
jgi:NADH-quinone oxidoreductase subunit C